jgi:hypothetical protein
MFSARKWAVGRVDRFDHPDSLELIEESVELRISGLGGAGSAVNEESSYATISSVAIDRIRSWTEYKTPKEQA